MEGKQGSNGRTEAYSEEEDGRWPRRVRAGSQAGSGKRRREGIWERQKCLASPLRKRLRSDYPTTSSGLLLGSRGEQHRL